MSAIRGDPSWNRPIFGVRGRPRTISRARCRPPRPGASIAAGPAGPWRDRGDGLGRLDAELGVREVQPVFRPADGRSLAAHRAALAARARARRDALPPATRAALPAVPELAEIYAFTLGPGADPV